MMEVITDKCKLCEKTTKTNGNQKEHVMTHKNKEENCTKCGKWNNIRTNPKVHDGRYLTDILKYASFVRKQQTPNGNQMDHVMTHKDKEETCTKCG